MLRARMGMFSCGKEAALAARIEDLATLLGACGMRHHADAEQGVIRVVFVTETYRNLRDEQLAIVTLATPEEGRIVRGTIEWAFACGGDAPRACEQFCRMAADTPLVGVEYDPDGDNLRMVVESCLEDAAATSQQVLSMLGRLVSAAEIWFTAARLMDLPAGTTADSRGRREQDAA